MDFLETLLRAFVQLRFHSRNEKRIARPRHFLSFDSVLGSVLAGHAAWSCRNFHPRRTFKG